LRTAAAWAGEVSVIAAGDCTAAEEEKWAGSELPVRERLMRPLCACACACVFAWLWWVLAPRFDMEAPRVVMLEVMLLCPCAWVLAWACCVWWPARELPRVVGTWSALL
jgi:hypothetical protein